MSQTALLVLQPKREGKHDSYGRAPFNEADLVSHILRTCPYMWQDQFNLHEKDGTSLDMCLLLLSLEAIERVCSQERSESFNTSRNKKALYSKKKATKQPGTKATARVPKKACAEKHCDLCKKHRGAYTTHNTKDCRWFEKDGTEKSDLRTTLEEQVRISSLNQKTNAIKAQAS
jgi:hypothetical protein